MSGRSQKRARRAAARHRLKPAMTDVRESGVRVVEERLVPPVAGTCRVCRCTDDRACGPDVFGVTCWWVDDTHTLCSSCAPGPAARARGVRRAA